MNRREALSTLAAAPFLASGQASAQTSRPPKYPLHPLR